MNKKKLIIIIAVIVIVILFFKTGMINTVANSISGINNSDNGADNGANTDISTYRALDDPITPGNGKGKEEKEAGKVHDQTKRTMTDKEVKDVASHWHELFDWIFWDHEFDLIIDDVKEHIFTRADLTAVMYADKYVYNRVYSWIVNDPNPIRLKMFNAALHFNGVEYTFVRNGEKL